MQTFWYYLGYYRDAVYYWWENIGPIDYGIVLLTIGLIGYWLMGSSIKRV